MRTELIDFTESYKIYRDNLKLKEKLRDIEYENILPKYKCKSQETNEKIIQDYLNFLKKKSKIFK